MNHLVVAIPVCHKDFDLVMRNLERCIRLDTSTSHHALVAYDGNLEEQKAKEVLAKARQYFKIVQVLTYGTYVGPEKWPRPQNYAWQNVARHFDTNGSIGRAWLWWEADAAPQKTGWLDTLYDAYIKGKRPFLGHVVEGRGHLNGVAIYPFNLSQYSVDAFLVKDVPFDLQLSQTLRIGRTDSLVCQRNDLIHHILKNKGGDAPSLINGDIPTNPTAVLCHGITHVVEQNGKVSEVPLIVEEFPFEQQTKLPCGMFELSGNTKTIYFNPSLIEFKDRTYLFARRTRWVNPNASKEGNNDLAIFDITDGTPRLVAIPKFTKTLAGEQWEDPRAIVLDGRVFVSFVKWFHRLNRFTYQSLMRLSEDWSSADVFLDAKFGGNGSGDRNGTQHEKNWTWFNRDGRWHCVYMTNPMIVYLAPEKGNRSIKSHKNPEMILPWKFGNPYGGTPPVLVGDEYVTFFHSFTPWVPPRRRYHMGAVTFDAKPPFALKRITVKPLLSGSEHDPRLYGGPPCIYPCGALLRNNEWLVVFGVNDENCGWINIPNEQLKGLMTEL